MSEWVNTTLDELATFQNGYPFKPADLDGSMMPVIRIKQLLDSDAAVDFTDAAVPQKFRIDDGDLIFSWSATLASVLWDRGPAYLNQHLFRVAERSGVDRRWLHYALDNSSGDFAAKSHGTTMKHVTKKALLAHQIALPPLAEQRRIVDVMASVDALVDSLAEEIKRANQIYRSGSSLLWLDSGGTDFPARPLREVMRLDVERVQLVPDRTYALAGVLSSGQGVIDKGPFLGRDTQYEAMNLLRADQVVMRKLTAWEGPITVVPNAFDGHVASNEFPTFTLSDDVDPAWMRHVCRTSRLWAEMKNRVTGSVQRRKRLNPDQLLSVSLPIPSRQVQERVSAGLDALDERVAALSDELAHLRSLRSALLASLLNQEIEIPASYDDLLEDVT